MGISNIYVLIYLEKSILLQELTLSPDRLLPSVPKGGVVRHFVVKLDIYYEALRNAEKNNTMYRVP